MAGSTPVRAGFGGGIGPPSVQTAILSLNNEIKKNNADIALMSKKMRKFRKPIDFPAQFFLMSAGTNTEFYRSLTLSNSNGISFGITGGTITASHNGLTSQSNQAVSAANGSYAFQTLSFSNANGISFGTSAGSAITGSYTVPTVTNSSMTVSDAATSGTLARLAFTNLNGVTLSLSSGAGGSHTIVGSHNAITSQSTQYLAITLGGNTAGTTTFHATNNASIFLHGGNNITLSGNGSSITISAGAGGAGSLNLSAGTTSNNLTNFVMSNANNLSFGLDGSTITGSFDPINIGMSTNGNTAGTTGTFDGAGLQYIFAGGNNVTLSQSSNGSSVTLSIAAAGGGGGATRSFWANIPNFQPMVTGASAITQTSGSSIFVQPFTMDNHVSMSYMRLLLSFNDNASGTAGTTSANTTFSVQRYTTIGVAIMSQGVGANSNSIQSYITTSVGITGYTRYSAGANGSQYTISIGKTYPATGNNNVNYGTSYAVSSGSIVISSNSNTLFTGPRFLDIPLASSLSPGNYWLAIGASTSSASNSSNISFAGTAAMALSVAGVSQSNVSVGILGAATAASQYQLYPGLGVWTTNASKFTTDSMGLNSISQVASNRQIVFQLLRQA